MDDVKMNSRSLEPAGGPFLKSLHLSTEQLLRWVDASAGAPLTARLQGEVEDAEDAQNPQERRGACCGAARDRVAREALAGGVLEVVVQMRC